MGQSLNYIMMLFMDIFSISFLRYAFRLKGYVILHCLLVKHVAIREILCLTLA